MQLQLDTVLNWRKENQPETKPAVDTITSVYLHSRNRRNCSYAKIRSEQGTGKKKECEMEGSYGSMVPRFCSYHVMSVRTSKLYTLFLFPCADG